MPSFNRKMAATKLADSGGPGLGGPGNDNSFEQAFSSLASAYLRDKAPALLQYQVGFQLVERDEDNNKAVGVFGFKAGPTWLLAPVFFVGGDLKGHELLLDKNEDQFIPLEEGWINDKLSRVPPALGEGVDRSGRNMGIRYPDLQRDLEGPRKYAQLVTPAERVALAKEAAAVMAKGGEAAKPLARMPDWAKVGVAALLATKPHPGHTPRLLDLLAEGGVKMAAALERHLEEYPKLRAGFDAFYTFEDVAAAVSTIKKAEATPKVAAPVRKIANGSVLSELIAEERAEVEAPRAKVAAYTFDGTWSDDSVVLDTEDKISLVRDGLLIKDARADDEVSKAYAVDVVKDFPAHYSNPDYTGIYDVLTKDGGTERCLIVIGPKGPAGPLPWATVVRLESGRRTFLNVHPNHIWTVRSPEGGQDAGLNDSNAWFDTIEGATSDRVSDGAFYLAIGRGGDGTVPFSVVDDKGDDAGGGKAYAVHFDTYAREGRSVGDAFAGVRCIGGSHYSSDQQRLHLGQRTGTRLRCHDGDVYVPEDHKILRLAPDAGTDDDKADDFGVFFHGRSKGAEPLRLGDSLSVQTGILRKTASLSLWVDGPVAVVNDKRMPVKKAIVHLVTEIGLREAVARDLLDVSARKWNIWKEASTFRIKVADPYQGRPFLTAGGPQAPGVLDPPTTPDSTFGDTVPAQAPFAENYTVSDMLPDAANRDAYRGETPPQPDGGAVQVAQQASESGQRELFDTALIGSLLKSTSDDAMVDRYMPDQMKALHNWGCMLLEFHWNTQRFAERYGEAEMPELEDSLRNTFETNGRTILFLRRKTTVASPDEVAMGEDLSDVAD